MSTETHAAENPQSQSQSKELVDIDDGAAVRRWTEALGFTDEALLKAIQVVGPRVDRITTQRGFANWSANG